VTRVTRDLI